MCDNGIEAEGAKALAAKFKLTLLQVVDLDYNEVVKAVGTIADAVTQSTIDSIRNVISETWLVLGL